MQTLAVFALIIGLVIVFRWLGPSTRRLPHEEKGSSKRNPEEDIPPPTIMG